MIDDDARAMARLMRLRRDLFAEVRALIAGGEIFKSYEGLFLVHMTSALEGENELGSSAFIELHCYVLGPSRHYQWKGRTLSEAVDACCKDTRKWIRESRRDRASEAAE